MQKWKRFEILAKEIQEKLFPLAEVKHNERIKGKLSGVLRQVDISMRTHVDNKELFTAIECKDYNRPVDVKDVETFLGLVKDVGAHKGAMVSYFGFTSAAKRVAEKSGLDLFRLIDVESIDWPVYLSAPVVCDFRGVKRYNFKFSNQPIVNTFIKQFEPNLIDIYDSEGHYIGKTGDYFRERWNAGELSDEIGYHSEEIIDLNIKIDDCIYPLLGKYNYEVNRRLFLGYVPIHNCKGYNDVLTGDVLTSSLTLGEIDFSAVENSWKIIESFDSIAITPFSIIEVRDLYLG